MRNVLPCYLMASCIHDFITKRGIKELIHCSISSPRHWVGRCNRVPHFVSLTKQVFLCQNTTHELSAATVAKIKSVEFFSFPFCRKRSPF